MKWRHQNKRYYKNPKDVEMKSEEKQKLWNSIKKRIFQKRKARGICPICGEVIYEDPTNIVIELSQKKLDEQEIKITSLEPKKVYFHFDCVLNILKEKFLNTEMEASKNTIMYLGGNRFGITYILGRHRRNGKSFEIIKVIDLKDTNVISEIFGNYIRK